MARVRSEKGKGKKGQRIKTTAVDVHKPIGIAELAKAIGVTAKVIKMHIARGAPATGGRMSVVVYAAWLVSQATD